MFFKNLKVFKKTTKYNCETKQSIESSFIYFSVDIVKGYSKDQVILFEYNNYCIKNSN